MNEKLLAHFAEQAGFCSALGSPFTGELIERMREDIVAGGPTAALVGDWQGNPRADAVALRLAGAAHAAVLTGPDTRLAQLFPAQNASWRMEEIWPAVQALFARDDGWIREFIRSAPQTNETRRSIALLAAFLAFARDWRGPIDTLELGASAGLNLHWDKFAYRPNGWSWGGDSAVVIDTDWNGPAPPINVRPQIRYRAACDLNPLDVSDDAQVLRLKSYIWADQPERMARLEGAVAIARDENVRVEQGDAADWVARKLASRAGDAATIVYHSIFLQYPPREARAAIAEAIESAGAQATAEAPLAWVRLEPEGLFGGEPNSARMVIDLITWPGGERRVLGHTDGHVRSVYAL